MLINPSGKPGKYRAVDWCVELNNLYTKASDYEYSAPNRLINTKHTGNSWWLWTESHCCNDQKGINPDTGLQNSNTHH